MSDIFIKSTSAHAPLQNAVEQVKQTFTKIGTLQSSHSKAVYSPEARSSLSHQDNSVLADAATAFSNLFDSIHDKVSNRSRQDANGKVVLSKESLALRNAQALSGMLMVGDDNGLMAREQRLQAPPATKFGEATLTVESLGGGNYNQRVIYTNEAFKNYDLENSRAFSALFNYSITDFDHFTRTIWRPVTISPDTSFVEMIVNTLTVFNGAEHKKNGKSTAWNRNNLVRAIADHTILHTDLTKAIPDMNGENDEFFMTRVSPASIKQADRDVTTAPLLAGVTDMNLISLAMPDWLTKTGELDQRDNLDPGVKIEKLYLALGNDVLEFPVLGIPGSEFNAAPQGDRQNVSLNWVTTSLPVDKNTLNVDGSPLTDLASVVSGELRLKIRIDVQAILNIETGDLAFNMGNPSIRVLQDKDGNEIASTDARYIEIKAALATVAEKGFTLDARRSNADRRQRGQLINIRKFAENVTVQWKDPITAERPAAASGEQDASDLTALMSATRMRVHNEGITAIFDAEEVFANTIVDENWNAYEAPTTLGVGRHWVLPYYHHETLDALKIVDSLKSSERNADIQAAVVATIRNRLAHAYTDSQYQAASDALSGGTAPKPKVALVCDPVVARYIIEPGELRTLVDFELVVVPVLDYRMRGKIKMVFITDDGGNDINFLNFGYLFWSPEQVLVANMTRTGGYNRETQMQPRYQHYVACPIMVSIDIVNIEAALAKMNVNIEVTGDVTVAP